MRTYLRFVGGGVALESFGAPNQLCTPYRNRNPQPLHFVQLMWHPLRSFWLKKKQVRSRSPGAQRGTASDWFFNETRFFVTELVPINRDGYIMNDLGRKIIATDLWPFLQVALLYKTYKTLSFSRSSEVNNLHWPDINLQWPNWRVRGGGSWRPGTEYVVHLSQTCFHVNSTSSHYPTRGVADGAGVGGVLTPPPPLLKTEGRPPHFLSCNNSFICAKLH